MSNNQQLSINLGLPATPDNTQDRELFRELIRIYNAINAVARGLDSYTGALPEPFPSSAGISNIHVQNIARLYPIFTEDVLAGAMINVYEVAGTLHARLAKAADALKPARGFVTSNILSGNRGELDLIGANYNLSGITPGTLYYLSPTSTTGQITSISPATPGNLIQPVGFGISSTAIWFNPTLLGDIVP